MKLNIDRITLLRELLVTQMNHWIFFPLYVTSMVICHDIIGVGTPHVFLWLAFGTIPLLLYLGRIMLRKFIGLLGLHLAVIGIMFLIPAEHTVVRIIYLFAGICYAVFSCYLWFKTEHRQDPVFPPLVAVIVAFAMLYILHYQGHTEWDGAYVTNIIVVLGLYFVIYYIERYQNFLKVNHSSAGHIPAAQMFRSGMGLVMGYTAIGIVVLLVISNIDWLKGILNLAKKAILSFLSFLFAFFPQGDAEYTPDTTTEIGITTMDGAGMLEADETFWLWDILEYIVILVIFVFAAIFIIKGIIFLYRFIRKHMNKQLLHREESAEEEVIDVREKCDIVKNKNHRIRLPFLALNPTERIRQLYKKRILSSKNAFPQGDISFINYYTVRESSKILERTELAQIYEKARYSNQECNNEDVRQMKNACK